MKIYLKNVKVNYTNIKKDQHGFIRFEEIEKKYPIGYIEHGLIFGISETGLIYTKKLDVEFVHHSGDEISEQEFKKIKSILTYKGIDTLEKSELKKELTERVAKIIDKINVTPEMFEDRKKYSDKWNKEVGKVGFKFSKKLGFMQVVNEIERQIKSKNI
jgi:hypothetical protein